MLWVQTITYQSTEVDVQVITVDQSVKITGDKSGIESSEESKCKLDNLAQVQICVSDHAVYIQGYIFW